MDPRFIITIILIALVVGYICLPTLNYVWAKIKNRITRRTSVVDTISSVLEEDKEEENG